MSYLGHSLRIPQGEHRWASTAHPDQLDIANVNAETLSTFAVAVASGLKGSRSDVPTGDKDNAAAF